MTSWSGEYYVFRNPGMACAHSLPRRTRRGLGLRAVRSAGRKVRRTVNEKLIAEDKRVNEPLSASEQWLQDVVDNTTAVIFVKDFQHRFLLTNREFERRFGIQRGQIRGKTDLESLPQQIAQLVREGDRQVIESGAPSQFEETLASIEGERYYVVAKFLLPDSRGKPFALCGIAMDITESKRTQEMQAAMARERAVLAQQCAAELGKANEAFRNCIDGLASVAALDDFLGQVMATMTRQLGSVSSTLRVRNYDQNTLSLELVFQDGRAMSPDEAMYPQNWRMLSIDDQRSELFLDQATTIISILDPDSRLPEQHRSYLLGLGVKTVLAIPLISGRRVNGRLSFRFAERRDFRLEELEIARALATQVSLAIQLTRLAKAARQSAVLEERTRLAREIHDALTQSFVGIAMELEVAAELLTTNEGDPLEHIQLAHDGARFGLAEARRSILSLQPGFVETCGLIEALQTLVEHSNIPGRLRCDFRSDKLPEKNLSPGERQELLRIAQEAISNAVRHAKPTVITVTLRWERPNLLLNISDNGLGMPKACSQKSQGFGIGNMRARASKLGGKLEIQSATGRGTSIVVSAPIAS